MSEDVPPRIAPQIDQTNRPFWTGGADGQLLIQKCQACGRWNHPPGAVCVTCGGELVPKPVSGRGSVFTYTVNRHPFNPSVPVPYVIAIVELEEQAGLRFTTNVIECELDDIHIGMDVTVAFEPAGEAWVPVFKPAKV